MTKQIEQLVAQFEHFLRLSSQKTGGRNELNADDCLYHFFNYFGKAKHPEDILRQDVEEYLVYAGKRGEKDIRYVKAFYNWLRDVKNYEVKNPAVAPKKSHWEKRAQEIATRQSQQFQN